MSEGSTENRTVRMRIQSNGNSNLIPSTIIITNEPPGHIAHHKKCGVVFSVHDLRFEITKERTASIIRNLIIQKSSDLKLREKIVTNLEKIARNFQHEKNLKEIPFFLPTKFFMKLLNDEKKFKLSKTEILGLLAFTDCYDLKGNNIDYLLFASYAVNAIFFMKKEKIVNGSPIEDLGSVRKSDSEVRTHIFIFIGSLYFIKIIFFEQF